MEKKPSLSVVVPAYNEERRLPATLRRLSSSLKEICSSYEVVVVDDGSRDATARVVEGHGASDPSVRLLRNGANRGKGFSVRRGVMEASLPFILLSDADLSTPVEEVLKLWSALDEGFDFAIGSRGMRESEIAVRQPWYREGMGKTFNLLVRLLVVGGFRDTQCGFKLMRAEAAKRVFSRCRVDGFSFDVEALFLATKLGHRIKEVPVRWLNSPESRVRLVGDPARMFLDLVRIRAAWAAGKYKEV